MEEAAGKQCHLQEHLTLITPVGILAQPFVFKCVLNIITVRSEGREKKLRIAKGYGALVLLKLGIQGVDGGFSGLGPPIIHGYKARSQGHGYL